VLLSSSDLNQNYNNTTANDLNSVREISSKFNPGLWNFIESIKTQTTFMKRIFQWTYATFGLLFFSIFAACKEKDPQPSATAITALNLKRGELIACGSPEKQFGSVGFVSSCSPEVKKDFELGVALLHSFEYDESEKIFARIIDQQPACAMAYWGVAMSNYHTLWAPPTEAELIKGSKAIEIAASIPSKTKREDDYIHAVSTFYSGWKNTDHSTRFARFEKAMEKLYSTYPDDKEASIFYALILTAAADPTDKTFTKQKKAAGILKTLYVNQPDHPGIIHYIIHSYDYPQLAELALPEARKYAAIAPSSAHAQHMPSHIFTRLGLWDEDIKSNLDAAASAKCYAESTGIQGHWDEELHAIDYLVYAYLQRGDNKSAMQQWDYLKSIDKVSPVNFKVAYAFAAVPSRYVLENRLWKEATMLELYPATLGWEKYPWQKSIYHFAKALGFANTANPDSARSELRKMSILRDRLIERKDAYMANQVHIQMKSAEAWIAFRTGKKAEALNLMNEAADMEDKTQKHPVTPGEVLPARELLGDMLMEINQPGKALVAYEASLVEHPGRFNGLYGAGHASELSHQYDKRDKYFRQLLKIALHGGSERAELALARLSLNHESTVQKQR
jgi:tetratricopeptide (TPR) repeat protein